jgi:predicted  nucleic acid-binding Zn-ribbon protein
MIKKQLEGEAEAKEQQIKKHQGELNSLKSNDAYKAMLTEIEFAKQALGKIEEDTLVAMEAIDAAEKDFKAKDQKVKSDENVVKAEIKTIEAEKQQLLDEEKAKRGERDTFEASIPENLRSHYNAIRTKRGGLAIVPITHNACSGCRMMLTPDKGVQAKKAKNMVVCDSCSRILYLPKETPTDANPAVAS